MFTAVNTFLPPGPTSNWLSPDRRLNSFDGYLVYRGKHLSGNRIRDWHLNGLFTAVNKSPQTSQCSPRRTFAQPLNLDLGL